MIQVIDQIGSSLSFTTHPLKVVCLVPSLTETLCYIGLEQNIVGITKFCVHPPHLTKVKNIIGGTKNPNIEKILALKPDLIIANKEENNKSDIDHLSVQIPVYTSDIKNIDDTILFVKDMQSLFSSSHASLLIRRLSALVPPNIEKGIRACYLIWKDPWMTVGNDTFIHYMMERYGYKNIFGHLERYPIITLEDINKYRPDIIMLSSEPFPFRHQHIQSIIDKVGTKNIILVDGEMFSWYGSRILAADNYITKINSKSTD